MIDDPIEGIHPEEEAAYKARSVHSKFMNTLLLGIGGATVYGLVGTFAKSLLEVATANAAAGAPIVFAGMTASALAASVGLVALVAAGLGCLMLGAKYLSKSIMNDQKFLAKQTGVATRAAVVGVEIDDPHSQTRGTGPANLEVSENNVSASGPVPQLDRAEAMAEQAAPATTIAANSAQLFDMPARETTQGANKNDSWASRVAANDNANATLAQL